MSDLEASVVRFVDPPRGPSAGEDFTGPEQAILDEINRQVAARQSLEAVIDFLFQATRRISPCDRIGLAFLDDEGRIVAHHAVAAYVPLLLLKGYAADLRGTTLGEVISRGCPRIINDLEKYSAARPASASTKLLLKEGVRANLTCPLRVEGRVVGVLFRSSRQPGVYDDRQVRLFLAVAERLSQAVEKTRRIEQLVAANQAYTEMLGFVSHELKSPVASMIMNARLLTDGYLGDVQPPQAEVLQRVISVGEHLLTLVRDYLDLARLEGQEVALHPATGVDLLRAVLEPSAEVVAVQAEARRMTLHLPAPGSLGLVEVDPELLRIVAVNLLGNAVKYGYEGGEVRVAATLEAGWLRISVWNSGPGFEESERGRLFRRFSRLTSPKLRKEKGTGLGLYSCWRLAKLHGGRITAHSVPDEWAEFVVEIPQPLPAGQPLVEVAG